MDEALKTATTVSEVLDATLPVLKPESLDAPPKPLGSLPARLAHYAEDLPPSPEWLPSSSGGGGQQRGADEAEGPAAKRPREAVATA